MVDRKTNDKMSINFLINHGDILLKSPGYFASIRRILNENAVSSSFQY